MKLIQHCFYALVFSFLLASCGDTAIDNSENTAEFLWQDNYTKKETYITMRDGIRLFTTIYSPKDTSITYPVILKRTPYSCAPYGADTLPRRLNHNVDLVKAGYIFITQDVRGRWMSEGDYENTKPPYSLKDSTRTDELTDTWDTFDWMLDSLANYNGSAGIYGTSYPGWATLVAARSNHPSIKAVIASAPVTNFYFEDFNRYGLFALNYLPVIKAFGTPRPNPVDTAWYVDKSKLMGIDDEKGIKPDYYDFYLDRMALSNFDDLLDSSDFFWKNIKAHANYDAYRKERDWAQYYNDIECQVMVLGGWNDEQNLYGILNSFKHIEKNSPNANAQFVMGPWSHGHPTRGDSAYYLGNIFFGHNLSTDYMKNVELPYFEKHLKGNGEAPNFKVKLYDTGKLEWLCFDKYPSTTNDSRVLYLNGGDSLIETQPTGKNQNKFREYVSDPFHPVPFKEGDEFYTMAPKSYFTADQRFAEKRPDVLTYESKTLKKDLTVLGEIKAFIDFATTKRGADIYVKIIDVHPMDRTPLDTDKEGVKMNGYQQLVRMGYIRGRYRDGFEKDKPFKSNEKTRVQVPMLDVFHTFKAGHKIMIQVQSSMYPLFDLNPQNYVEDIYNAKNSDFTKAMHKVFVSSYIELPIYNGYGGKRKCK